MQVLHVSALGVSVKQIVLVTYLRFSLFMLSMLDVVIGFTQFWQITAVKACCFLLEPQVPKS